MNSKRRIPSIPIDGPISWEDWLAGRKRRREAGNRVAPAVICRRKSSGDRRLKRLFRGKRGLSFRSTSEL
ncbi:MAG TPA: hypothetical protein VMP11_19910 [Verrucomicrobiae bacterium]|nr:hypothetical protein [Verrucomicrobiae bacterium]